MSTVKVPLFKSPQRFATVDPSATEGAILGLNLRWPDGRLVTKEDLQTQPPEDDGNVGGISRTLWDLIVDIPENIRQLAVLGGDGFAYRDAGGTWRLRHVGRSVVGFAYGEVSPRLVFTAPHPLLVVLCRIVVTQPFDGIGAELSVGTPDTPGLVQDTTDNDPATATGYESTPNVLLEAGDTLQLTITPGAGATAGAGQIILDTIPLEGI